MIVEIENTDLLGVDVDSIISAVSSGVTGVLSMFSSIYANKAATAEQKTAAAQMALQQYISTVQGKTVLFLGGGALLAVVILVIALRKRG